MIDINKVIKTLERFAPIETAQEWDNSGWQIHLGKSEAKNLLICLTLTPKILEQAIENDCDLIISHHPVIFKGMKSIGYNTVGQKLIVDCIKNDIQVYSAHTNLDIAKGGVNDILCEKLGLTADKTINEFVKIAHLPSAMSLDTFILKLKISLNAPKLKLINPDNIQEIKKVALCSGSGGEFVEQLTDVDAFITGDIKYHTALDVQNMVLIDAGHFETEKVILQTLKTLFNKVAPDLVVAKETEPWIVV